MSNDTTYEDIYLRSLYNPNGYYFKLMQSTPEQTENLVLDSPASSFGSCKSNGSSEFTVNSGSTGSSSVERKLTSCDSINEHHHKTADSFTDHSRTESESEATAKRMRFNWSDYSSLSRISSQPSTSLSHQFHTSAEISVDSGIHTFETTGHSNGSINANVEKPNQRWSSSNKLHSLMMRLSCEGRDHVDFLKFFNEKFCLRDPTEKILQYLDAEDLLNSMLVSKLWYSVVMASTDAQRRINLYKTQNPKENRRGRYVKADLNTEPENSIDRCSVERISLAQIQNIDRSRSSRVNTSKPSFSVNFEAYRKEAEKTTQKRLFPCPRCNRPSHIDENCLQSAAECSSCHYRFCFNCGYGEHPKTICHFASSTPIICKAPRGNIFFPNEVSRKNLKRLLL